MQNTVSSDVTRFVTQGRTGQNALGPGVRGVGGGGGGGSVLLNQAPPGGSAG
jgi:hypothetical protein